MTGTWVGSHHYVFDYVPLKEIWISDKLPVEERSRVILHEYTERALMERGMNYAEAHEQALRTEGKITEAEIVERSYLPPEKVSKKLDETYSKNENSTWQMGNHVIKYDTKAGIIYVYDGEKIIDQLLVRSIDDLEKFIQKLDTEFRKS